MVELKFDVGDKIDLTTLDKKYEGTVLDSDDSSVVLLKLKSGYNLGIRKEKIRDYKILEKSREMKEYGDRNKINPNKPNIGMILTGGTISARYNAKKGGVDWLTSPEMFFKFYPEIFEKVNVLKLEVPFMKASEDMDYKDWQKIAKVAEKMLNDSNIQGIIISHGTDFLHYTASALGFFLKNLSKPVVLTYSQRSIDRASSDATLNLECSAVAATSNIAEVMLVGHASSGDDFCYAMPATKVRKLHSSRRDAFKTVNSKPFAKIFPNGKIENLREFKVRPEKNSKVSADTKFEEKIALVKVYPGQNPEILDFYLKNKYKGIVLEVAGLGHVPTKRARLGWTNKLKEVISKGLVVCAAAQTVNGRLNPLVYSNGREILETGVIYLDDMLSETAFVKLGWVLGHTEWAKDKKVVKEKMLENFANEFNKRIEFEN